ncbi:hypothetical protein [Nocardioides sp. ChNu-99]|uniref:hypothetical protein n=1 Tax=Nocardioides sp. ChNu-99 TaxID=2839897 RepID=UPI002404A927|nr:hypothetical protein [Nocardioides sp. ChNu-99]MDF9716046.1 hypothetical protein [Nocardioides sp. ChNu-99]
MGGQHRASDPTQVRRPWRATARTALQTTLAVVPVLGFVVPEIVSIVLEEAGESMPAGVRAVLLAASAVIVGVASAAARIMAIPQVERFLVRHKLVRALAANPSPRQGAPS